MNNCLHLLHLKAEGLKATQVLFPRQPAFQGSPSGQLEMALQTLEDTLTQRMDELSDQLVFKDLRSETPDFNCPFKVQKDTSNIGLHTVLTQDHEDGFATKPQQTFHTGLKMKAAFCAIAFLLVFAGRVQCCPIGTTCSDVKGIQNCNKIPRGTCNIYGDTHYNTFDNSTYNFQGTCTYTATQGCHLEGTNLTPFSVVVENERWNEIQQTPNVSMAKVVVVEVYNMTIILRRNQIHQVMINGILTNIPVNLNDGEVIIQQEGDFNVILTNFGLRVAYDMIYHVIITVPGTYAGKTCGMCGNFNSNKRLQYYYRP
ncbi:zonadhesin-like [Clarias gariepinus]|uniref:zonadhesin-like n=1 Tax=Clarias gariepinus TaxID=13013 RepID=UPI00234DC68A|nr:zonadhesin-like [Clarias gariepinus]